MKKIITAVIFIFISTSAFSAEPLVDVKWLNKNLNNKNVFILDIRNKIDGGSYETFKQAHIPGAVHSDYLRDGWRAKVNGVIGQFPGKKPLEQLVGGSFCVSRSSLVILLDAIFLVQVHKYIYNLCYIQQLFFTGV